MTDDDGRYTLAQAAGECAGGLAAVSVLDAIVCVLLAALGCPRIVNVVLVAVCVPAGAVAAVVGRWRRGR